MLAQRAEAREPARRQLRAQRVQPHPDGDEVEGGEPPVARSDRTPVVTGTGRARALAEGLFAVLVWGASFIATKVALTEVSPATVVWLRFAMGVAVLGVAVTAARQWARSTAADAGHVRPPRTDRDHVPPVAAVDRPGDLAGEHERVDRRLDAGVHGDPRAGFVLKERLGASRIAGIALAAIGVSAGRDAGDPAALLHGQFGAPGDILILISAPNWAVFSVLSRRALRSHPAIRMMAYVMGIGWLFSVGAPGGGPGLSEVASQGDAAFSHASVWNDVLL